MCVWLVICLRVHETGHSFASCHDFASHHDFASRHDFGSRHDFASCHDFASRHDFASHSLTHLPTHSLSQSLTHSLTCLVIHSLPPSLTHTHTHSRTRSLAHTHSFTHSFTHSLVHSLTRSLNQPIKPITRLACHQLHSLHVLVDGAQHRSVRTLLLRKFRSKLDAARKELCTGTPGSSGRSSSMPPQQTAKDLVRRHQAQMCAAFLVCPHLPRPRVALLT